MGFQSWVETIFDKFRLKFWKTKKFKIFRNFEKSKNLDFQKTWNLNNFLDFSKFQSIFSKLVSTQLWNPITFALMDRFWQNFIFSPSAWSVFSHSRLYFPGRFQESSANIGSDFLNFWKVNILADFSVLNEIVDI